MIATGVNGLRANLTHSASCAQVRSSRPAVHSPVILRRGELALCKRRTLPQRMQCGLAIFLMSLVPLVGSAATGVAVPAGKLSLIGVYSTAAIVTWDADYSVKISSFEMTVRTRDSSAQLVFRLPGTTRTHTVRGLRADTEYQAFLATFSSDVMESNVSDVITFRTLSATSTVEYADINGAGAEYVIVILVIFAWIAAVVLFLNKWRSIRILQPSEPRYRHSPKNIENIRVVKDATDSVIHKNYPQALTDTMLAREKRIMQRMHTMPNIKVESGSELMKSHENKREEDNVEKKRNRISPMEDEVTSDVTPTSQTSSHCRDEHVQQSTSQASTSTSQLSSCTSHTPLSVIVADDLGEEQSQQNSDTKM